MTDEYGRIRAVNKRLRSLLGSTHNFVLNVHTKDYPPRGGPGPPRRRRLPDIGEYNIANLSAWQAFHYKQKLLELIQLIDELRPQLVSWAADLEDKAKGYVPGKTPKQIMQERITRLKKELGLVPRHGMIVISRKRSYIFFNTLVDILGEKVGRLELRAYTTSLLTSCNGPGPRNRKRLTIRFVGITGTRATVTDAEGHEVLAVTTCAAPWGTMVQPYNRNDLATYGVIV